MKESNFSLVISDLEKRILIQGLTLLKTKQINENKKYDFIDDLIIKACDAPAISNKKKHFYEER
ncbi:hypothetical protein [Faecalibacillus intestinalis]|uniref:hypothetical protein n=1 Tax=Faecalibacillus intestinalis TaxID=1982626 RepID=UPI0022E3DF04|nr:hypothetical protein [Faecalibacillus intestinalis]